MMRQGCQSHCLYPLTQPELALCFIPRAHLIRRAQALAQRAQALRLWEGPGTPPAPIGVR